MTGTKPLQVHIDSMHLSCEHIRGGKFVIRQTKTGKTLVLPIAPQLLEAMVSMPHNSDNLCLLATEFGKPFSRKGFGNKFRQWCDEAGLDRCTAHGLRKATLRRMADLRMSNKSMKSVSGHSKNDEIDRYTQAADQERLAQGAIQQLSKWEAAPTEDRDDRLAASAAKALEAWRAKGQVSNQQQRLDWSDG